MSRTRTRLDKAWNLAFEAMAALNDLAVDYAVPELVSLSVAQGYLREILAATRPADFRPESPKRHKAAGVPLTGYEVPLDA